MRIMKLRRRQLKLRDKVKTKCQLVILKRTLLPIFKEMGLNRNKIRNVSIRLGENRDFEECCQAYFLVEDNEIILRRNNPVYLMVASISHEIGHKITFFGNFGISKKRRNILGETSAYNFQKKFINIFNEIKGCNMSMNSGNFFIEMKNSPIHYISRILRDVPLGSLIRNEYKNK